jgi:hypothetical protein
MNMKKLIAIALVALVGTSFANAKLVRSRTVGEKAKTPTEWIVRIGASINNAAGEAVKEIKYDYSDGDEYGSYSVGPRVGMDVSVAFNKPMGSSGAYWGMELGFGSRGASAKTADGDDDYYENSHQHIATWNLKYSPFTFGYKYAINTAIKLDVHLGAYVSYDFAGSGKATWEWDEYGEPESETETYSLGEDMLDGFQRFDAGIQAGVGVWYKKFNFDITYQRGFVSACEVMIDWSDTRNASYKVFSSNLMLRVGYSF